MTTHVRCSENLRSRYHNPDSGIVLSFLSIDYDKIDAVDGRVCLLDAIKFVCFAEVTTDPFLLRMEFDHRDAYYDLVNNEEPPLLSWDDACTVTRELMDAEEQWTKGQKKGEKSYKEEVFVAFRLPKVEVVGKGRMLNGMPRDLEELEMTEAEEERERQEILRLERLQWPEEAEPCSIVSQAQTIDTFR